MRVGRTGVVIGGLVAAGAATAGIAFMRRGGARRDATPVSGPPPAPSRRPSPVPPTPTPPPRPTGDQPASPRPEAPAPVTEAPAPAQSVSPDDDARFDAAPIAATEASGQAYTVRSGDTLSAIGRRFGVSAARIAEANGIENPDRIRVGQRLHIPSGSQRRAPAPAQPPRRAPSDGNTPAVQAGPPVRRVDGAGRRVALTFDDGPSGPTTDAIVGTLERHGVRGTFFVIGRQAARDGARLARMRDAGHVVANHSWDHAKLTSLSDAQVRTQLLDTTNAIERATGRRPGIFRPPYGSRDARVDRIAAELGLRDVLWDVDTRDWARPGADAIRRTAVDGARDGSIVLLHDGGGDRRQTVAALDGIIQGLRERGFELVTVPELLGAAG